jgi:group I intron endonuclease
MTSKANVSSGIYKITNINNGFVYVGSAVNLQRRKTEHFSKLKKGLHHSSKLQNSFLSNGDNAFVFDIVELVEDKTKLIQKEQYYIDSLNAFGKSGYNMRPIAESALGVKQTKEWVEKRMAHHIGAKRSQETKDRISLATKGRSYAHLIGVKRTDEVKAKISKTKSGVKLSPEHAGKVRKGFLGRSHSQESIEKISVAQKISMKERWQDPEFRAMMISKKYGRVVSEETRAKISAAKKRLS